jgi:hypothetical protein
MDSSLPETPMPSSPLEVACNSKPFSPFELRRWLRRDWALVFSHPEDFASYGFEADRWLVHVSDAFSACRVRAVAICRVPNKAYQNWLTDIDGCTANIDLQLGSARRFVAIVDGSLRTHRTFTYDPHDLLPPLLDLPAIASAQRERYRREKRNDRMLRLIAATTAIAIGMLTVPRLRRAYKATAGSALL